MFASYRLLFNCLHSEDILIFYKTIIQDSLLAVNRTSKHILRYDSLFILIVFDVLNLYLVITHYQNLLIFFIKSGL